MEKIKFVLDGTEETEFFVLEQTRINGVSYLLVSDSEDDEAECLILKDTSTDEDRDSIYEIIEDDTELLAVSKMFEELLEDTTIEL
ncbi:DUF1292 domain-containing protein [Lachnoclostridium sp. An181]|uniref:DUF1292 domain-containing protein n=1 Tax=Lachnoclostridium sp. An181 TaxID=1965575 RepID=UPI000B373ED4|nr:DUF1292 domain-containing protein [Lachnoclostridium sp. An181]OUP50623.1 hypothetical protein B5F18_03030 [Lachnoclostridium sp. An181]